MQILFYKIFQVLFLIKVHEIYSNWNLLIKENLNKKIN